MVDSLWTLLRWQRSEETLFPIRSNRSRVRYVDTPPPVSIVTTDAHSLPALESRRRSHSSQSQANSSVRTQRVSAPSSPNLCPHWWRVMPERRYDCRKRFHFGGGRRWSRIAAGVRYCKLYSGGQ